MKIVDSCGCDEWALVLAKDLFRRNNIPCEEAAVVDMDYKWINLDAEVRIDDCADPNDGWDPKRYVIKYWVDQKFLFVSRLSIWFYERETYDFVNPAGEVHEDTRPADIEKCEYLVVKLFGHAICKKIG